MADVAIPEISGDLPGTGEPAERWSLWRRIGFRFVCSYFTLYCLSGAVTSVPGGFFLALPCTGLWHVVCPWVAIHFFHLRGQVTTYFVTGSGDTTLEYIQNLLVLLTAVLATGIWSVLDRKRADYRGVRAWLRVLVRYTLAFTLFGYGFDKVFPLQFQPAKLYTLLEPFGQLSPMGVLWSFMGASIPYIIFSGVAEVTGGLLLLSRRTTTLGALVSAAVLANVVALNFCYDVPVKLYSSNLLAMAVFLAAGDAQRVLNVLVLNRPAPAADLGAPRFPGMRGVAMGLWIALVGLGVLGHVGSAWRAYRQTYVNPARPPLAGAYDVESFQVAGKELPPLFTDSGQWRKVEFGMTNVMVQSATDARTFLGVTYVPNTNTIVLNGRDKLKWWHADATHVMFEGSLNGGDVSIRLRALDLAQMPLNIRGFHWITEFPFNR